MQQRQPDTFFYWFSFAKVATFLLPKLGFLFILTLDNISISTIEQEEEILANEIAEPWTKLKILNKV